MTQTLMMLAALTTIAADADDASENVVKAYKYLNRAVEVVGQQAVMLSGGFQQQEPASRAKRLTAKGAALPERVHDFEIIEES